MAAIGFIGLGNMGGPMAANLVKAGHRVTGFDLVPSAAAALAAKGGSAATSAVAAAVAGEIVITMLPAGPQVRSVYLGPDGVLAPARKDALLIDCSTIDVETARRSSRCGGSRVRHARRAGLGRGGRRGGGDAHLHGRRRAAVFARAQPILAAMGRTIVHAGPAGNGQAAKICNNMILGISMIAVSRPSRLPSGSASRRRPCSTSRPNRLANAGRLPAIVRSRVRSRPRQPTATTRPGSPRR